MKRIEAIKTYFGQGEDARPVTNAELINFRKEDAAGFNEIAELCAQALGATLDAAA